MRATLCLVICCLLSSYTAAESCCVDEDIAAAFLQHTTYSREWPGSLPIELTSDSLEFIGSSDQGGYVTTVAWKSAAAEEETREIFAKALIAEGWTPMPENEHLRSRMQRGFVGSGTRRLNTAGRYCRKRDGIFSVHVKPTSVGLIAVLSLNKRAGNTDCAGLIATQTMPTGYLSGLLNYLPVLSLPSSVQTLPYAGSGVGGGSNDAHAELTVETSVSGSDIVSSFGAQMSSQDWTLDTTFAGDVSSGSVWLREANGLQLTCLLTAVDGGPEVRLRMHVEPLP